MSMANVAFRIFGDRLKKKNNIGYDALKKSLRQAKMPVSFEMYMSSVYLYSLITGVVGAVIGAIISYVYTQVIGLPEQMTKVRVSEESAWIFEYREVFVVIAIMLLCVAGIGGVTYLILRVSPSLKAGNRKSSIDKVLPYAVTFMYALSRGGMNVLEVFRSLADSEDTYGEVSKEAASIIRDMEFFGYDLRTAFQNSIESTPSLKFQELMHSLLTVIDSGGDIVAFFADKSDEYLDAAIMDQKGFLATLELIAESYVTAFVAGPLFIIVIQTVMSVMGSAETMALYAIIYMMIPVGSFMFVFMIYIMTPTETGKFVPLETETKYGTEIGIPDDNEETELFTRLDKGIKGISLREGLRNPMKPIKEEPLRVLIITAPIAIGMLAYEIYMGYGYPGFVIDGYLVLAAYIILLPLAILFESKSRKEKRIKREIPDFLHRLAITNEIGMTLTQSIELMSKSDSGSITPEVKKIWNDIDWGLGVNDAFMRFANRLKMASVARTVT
ncbi:MAG: type II secretion system F family protein, partial [Halobacteriota archaeon]|nr:type II secretion system F family protein [Halobacteriota archaeon]